MPNIMNPMGHPPYNAQLCFIPQTRILKQNKQSKFILRRPKSPSICLNISFYVPETQHKVPWLFAIVTGLVILVPIPIKPLGSKLTQGYYAQIQWYQSILGYSTPWNCTICTSYSLSKECCIVKVLRVYNQCLCTNKCR